MQVDKQLLEKYFKGHCTAAEAAFVEAYLLQGHTPEIDAYLLDTWEQASKQAKDTTKTPAGAPAKVVKLYRRWYSIAAALLLLLSVSAWLWQWQQGRPVKALALQWDTIYNGGNYIRLVSMPDGSRVWLSAHASLAYTSDYNTAERAMWLEGEAYFEVARMEGRPFRVHTDDLVTTALGTAFNIATANHADSSIAVSLLEGKVAVNAAGFSCVLQPGQRLLYKKGVLSPGIARFNAAETLDWKNGKLVFDNTALEDAFAKLQSRYGCKIQLQDPALAKKRISGVFYAKEPISMVLQKLGYVHSFRYEQRTDSNYIIKKI